MKILQHYTTSLFFIIGFILLPFITIAEAEVIVLNEKIQNRDFLKHTFEVFETTNEELDISEVVNLNKLFKEPKNPNQHRPNDKIYWVKFTVFNQFQDKRSLVLTFFSHEANEIQVYIPDDENHYYLNTQGASFPFSLRLYPNKNFIFNLPYSAKPTVYYMRVSSHRTIGLNFKVQTIEGFVFDHSKRYNLTFFIFGLLFMVVLINGYIYVQTLKAPFVLFIMYTLTAVGYLMNLDGLDFQFLWPNQPALNYYSFQLTNFLCIVSSLLLTISILNLKRNKRYLYGVLILIGIKLIAILIVYRPAIQMKIDVVILLFPVVISTYYVITGQKNTYKYFNQYNLANFIFILCYLMYSFALDGLRFEFDIFPIIKIGVLIQIILISKNLMQKYNHAIFKSVEKKKELELQQEIKQEYDGKIKLLNEKLSVLNSDLKSSTKELEEKSQKYSDLKSSHVLLKVAFEDLKNSVSEDTTH